MKNMLNEYKKHQKNGNYFKYKKLLKARIKNFSI